MYEDMQTRIRNRKCWHIYLYLKKYEKNIYIYIYSDSTKTNLGYLNRLKSGLNLYSFFIRAELKQKSFKIVPLMWNNKLLSALVRSLPLFSRASSSLSSLLSFRRRVKHVLSHKSASLSRNRRRGMGEGKGEKYLCRS